MTDWMNHPDRMMGWWMTGWGWFWLILLCVVVIALVVLLFTRSKDAGSSSSHRNGTDPLGILEERFARGEIDQAEFEARRAQLRKDGS